MGSGSEDCICWCKKWDWKYVWVSVFAPRVFTIHDPKGSCIYANATQSSLLPLQSPIPPSPTSSHTLSSEYHTLESSILRVVHHDWQQDADDDGASSAVTTVTRELLQEAADHIGAALGETLGGEEGTGTPPGRVMGRWRRTHKSADVTRLTPTRREGERKRWGVVSVSKEEGRKTHRVP